MTHRRRYGSQGLEAAALLVTGLHELFRVHATPPSEGSWQPVSLATVEIEVAAYEAQSGRKLS